MILTRILTLDGLEHGINRGPGCDSLARYIYLHGTNQEHLIGRPLSHGCVRLANDDVRELFERVREGDLVFIAAPDAQTIPDPWGGGRFHYAGLGGAGMSALAQFQAMTGGRVSGSDRAFDHGERAGMRAQLERLGIAVLPQDGSGLGSDCVALVVSTAVEDTVPDVAAARAQRHSHRPSLGAAGAFRGAASLDRDHRHERQVDRYGDGVRPSQGRRPRPVGDHRRRSA